MLRQQLADAGCKGALAIMSCWVVPSVAAELWGCSVEAIHAGIRDGSIPMREENGWTFIDMAPQSPRIEAPKAVKPPTFSVVSAEELIALSDDRDIYSEYTEPEPSLEEVPQFVEPLAVMLDGETRTSDIDAPVMSMAQSIDDAYRDDADDEESGEALGDWREVRERVAATRRAPREVAAPLREAA
jgi:hypothetical protein